MAINGKFQLKRIIFRTTTVTVDGIVSQTITDRACSIQGDHSGRNKPPVDLKTKVPLWPDLAWPGQAKAELLF